jgi:hypothetical protein
MALAVLGALVAVGWLLLALAMAVGGTSPGAGRPVAAQEPVRASARTSAQEETSTGDLVLPVTALGAAVAIAVYAYVRRTRRAATRTTPGGSAGDTAPAADDLDARGRRLLLEADDCVRTSEEELRFVTGQFGERAARPFEEALEFARRELGVAFRLRQRLDDSAGQLSAEDERAALEEIVSRCSEAGRRLDSETAAFDQLRALETDPTAALAHAETRFRELTGRVPAADATLTGLRERYAPSATLTVVGHPEQARDRLVFATFQLNRARQAADAGDTADAAARLRAAEGAVHQAGVFVDAVDRLAAELASAEELLPEALKEGASRGRDTGTAAWPGRSVQKEMAAGPYDPLDALRRLSGPLQAARGALAEGSLLAARSAVAAADDFVTTHRAAVGVEARIRLAEAERRLAQAADEPDRSGARRADVLASGARQSAEQDVRAHGTPYGGALTDGLGGALLGGVLIGAEPGGGGPRGPACFGGPTTRERRATGRF